MTTQFEQTPPSPSGQPHEGRIARGFRLARESFAVILSDRRLVVPPLLATSIMLLGTGAVFVPAVEVAPQHHGLVLLAIVLWLGTFAATFVGTFCNVALIHMVQRRWAGEEATVRDGFDAARERLGVIAAWSLVAATVGTVLRVLERVHYTQWIAALLSWVAGLAWGIATFFVVPALALEGLGPLRAIRRSSGVVRKRWAEGLTGGAVIGGAAALLMIPGLLVLVASVPIVVSSPATGMAVAAIGVLLFLPVATVFSAVSEVFTLAVYRYASEGTIIGPFAESDLARPFSSTKKRRSGGLRGLLARPSTEP